MATKEYYTKLYDDLEKIVETACEANECSTCPLKRNGICIKADVEIGFEHLIEEHFATQIALKKACGELVKMCKQTECKNCHFVKEQTNYDNDCPVEGSLTPHDWEKWSFKDETNK